MIQPSHYVSHAIEQFSKYRFLMDRLRLARPVEQGISDDKLHQGINLLAHDCAVLLHHAEKFVMPEWGRIFDKDELDVVSDVPAVNRLPYPVVACEFSCDYALHNNIGPGEQMSSKRIALLVERAALMSIAPQIAIMSSLDDTIENRGYGDGFAVLPICFFDATQFWIPPPAIAWRAVNEPVTSLLTTVVPTPMGIASYQHFPHEERVDRALKDVSDETICAMHLLLALAMERTTSTTIPAPAKLNKKRERNKKPPIYEYKVLDIVADIMEAPRESIGRPHGRHASPRMHKRRGHLRRLSADRVTWVRNTIVGKPGGGEIAKDYTVRKETHGQP